MVDVASVKERRPKVQRTLESANRTCRRCLREECIMIWSMRMMEI